MKAPTKPKAPPKPTEPKKSHPRQVRVQEWLGYDGKYTLKELLSKLPAGITGDDLTFFVREFNINSGYYNNDDDDDYSDYVYGLECVYSVYEENNNYNTEYKLYKTKLTKYEQKVKDYNAALVEYEKEMKVFNDWSKKEKLKEEAAELVKLKERVAQLEKKISI